MFDTHASPLVLTKLHVPAARPGIVHRARLLILPGLEDSPAVILASAA